MRVGGWWWGGVESGRPRVGLWHVDSVCMEGYSCCLCDGQWLRRAAVLPAAASAPKRWHAPPRLLSPDGPHPLPPSPTLSHPSTHAHTRTHSYTRMQTAFR